MQEGRSCIPLETLAWVMYRRVLKALHALGTIGFMGGIAACLVLVSGLLSIDPAAKPRMMPSWSTTRVTSAKLTRSSSHISPSLRAAGDLEFVGEQLLHELVDAALDRM